MPYALKDRKVLITGGSRGLGAAIAQLFAAQGAHIAINYNASAAPAEELASKLHSEYGVKAIALKGDAGSRSSVEEMVASTASQLGGLDIVIANAGWTRFGDFNDLDALTDEEWDKAWNVNVKGPLHLVRAAKPILDQNPEGGVCIITSSIAGSSVGGSSMAYSVTKAAQLHLMKCLAKTQGPKMRINAVLPGLLLTEWGLLYGDRIEMLKDMAALKSDTNIQDCAEVYIMLAKNTSMTGQRVQVDAGLNIQSM